MKINVNSAVIESDNTQSAVNTAISLLSDGDSPDIELIRTWALSYLTT
jgi:hypothetical protein